MTPDDKPSKSQKKRDMQSLKDMAVRLVELPIDQTNKIDVEKVRTSVDAARKITKGNARKRQIQFIAKLLSKIDTAPIQDILDILDASSAAHVQRFHQLEIWREQLTAGDKSVMEEVINQIDEIDRQQLRQLSRNAAAEREAGAQTVAYKKLFQFLKKESEAS
jgi:ribosome-associated protein